MSHFTVAVIMGEEPTEEKLVEILEPYNEQTEDLRYAKLVKDEDDGHEYYSNPNAKWDWWVVGGRWDEAMPVKTGGGKNVAQIKDIVLTKEDPEKPEYYARVWDYLTGAVSDEDTPDNIKVYYASEKRVFGAEYWVNKYGSKEQYIETKMLEDYIESIESEALFAPYAFVDKNGKWHEPGTMGWFGMSDATEETYVDYYAEWKKYIESCNPDDYIVLLDCHI